MKHTFHLTESAEETINKSFSHSSSKTINKIILDYGFIYELEELKIIDMLNNNINIIIKIFDFFNSIKTKIFNLNCDYYNNTTDIYIKLKAKLDFEISPMQFIILLDRYKCLKNLNEEEYQIFPEFKGF